MRRGWAVLSLTLLLAGAGVAAAKPAYSLPEAVSMEDREAAALARTCPRGRWSWSMGNSSQPVEFSTPAQPLSLEVELRAGRLSGINRGEFGGELWVKHADGREILMSVDAVEGLQQTPHGAIVLFGQYRSTGGYAMLAREMNGHLPLHLIGILPGRPIAIADIGGNALAVRVTSGRNGKARVSVISEYSVLGEASCLRDRRGRR